MLLLCANAHNVENAAGRRAGRPAVRHAAADRWRELRRRGLPDGLHVRSAVGAMSEFAGHAEIAGRYEDYVSVEIIVSHIDG